MSTPVLNTKIPEAFGSFVAEVPLIPFGPSESRVTLVDRMLIVPFHYSITSRSSC